QDALFFATAERIARRAIEVTADYLILDLRRVYDVDAAAVTLMARLADTIAEQGRKLLFAHLRDDSIFETLSAEIGKKLGKDAMFADCESALEHCENRLLAERTADTSDASLSLSELEIFRGFTRQELQRLEAVAQAMTYNPGDVIVREGDKASLFFVIARGVASVRITVDDGGRQRAVRLASIGRGVSFGEMALLDGGRRSADVVAEERVLCYGFSVEELHEIGRDDPGFLVKLFGNMARDLSERLRRANGEIRALEN
ncbi:MAG: cyclic nucleotide-binding domain-containing protein, partial [Caulobacterales bacterium]